MEALRYDATNTSLSLQNVEIPQVKTPTQLLIQVKYAGLCGTDLHIIQGEFSNCKSDGPVTLGHEFCGVVVDGGNEGLEKYPKGTRVGIDPNTACNKCEFCSEAKYHFCQTKGVHDYCIGLFKDGGFAKYCLVPMENVTVLPDDVTFQQGCLCEPLSCLLHGWNRLQKIGPVEPNSKILILGAGIIGNLWALMFHHSGYRNVTISELSPKRRAIAANMDTGFAVLDPNELEREMGKKTTLEIDLSGFDIIIECTGFPPALEKAIKWTKRGATVCIFGCSPPGKEMRICPEEIFNKELTLFGTLVNPYTYSRAVVLASNFGQDWFNYQKLGIKSFGLKDYQEALNELKQGNISKAVFEL